MYDQWFFVNVVIVISGSDDYRKLLRKLVTTRNSHIVNSNYLTFSIMQNTIKYIVFIEWFWIEELFIGNETELWTRFRFVEIYRYSQKSTNDRKDILFCAIVNPLTPLAVTIDRSVWLVLRLSRLQTYDHICIAK